MSEWVRTFEQRRDYMESLDGIAWADAPLPRWLHRCRPQTRGLLGLDYVERCPCGAIRFSSRDRWIERNQTRRYRRRWS